MLAFTLKLITKPMTQLNFLIIGAMGVMCNGH